MKERKDVGYEIMIETTPGLDHFLKALSGSFQNISDFRIPSGGPNSAYGHILEEPDFTESLKGWKNKDFQEPIPEYIVQSLLRAESIDSFLNIFVKVSYRSHTVEFLLRSFFEPQFSRNFLKSENILYETAKDIKPELDKYIDKLRKTGLQVPFFKLEPRIVATQIVHQHLELDYITNELLSKGFHIDEGVHGNSILQVRTGTRQSKTSIYGLFKGEQRVGLMRYNQIIDGGSSTYLFLYPEAEVKRLL